MVIQAILLILAGVGAQGTTADFASSSHRDDWVRNTVLGDPSFDSFQRMPGNPIYRGAPPFEWPVNGFLFEDPRSGDWFVYIGLYAKNYAMTEDRIMRCLVCRSKDHGASWEQLGCPFPDEPFRFDPDTSPVGHAPDVSVLYADGRYHMIYDWATADTHWDTTANPSAPADNGIGYAWAEHPEGPFIRTSPAVYRTGKSTLQLGKYRRGYAASIVKRDHDWMVLFMMDSGPNFSWGLFGVTSQQAEGPYSDPIALRTVEGDYYHPPLLEFFPAFQYDGHVYAPATSVALNRNFQGIFRARTEEAHRPGAWELFQCGSVWHAEPVPNEYYGIWGQTLSGFVDRTGTFNVMFASRDPQGMGTINLARRPWNQLFRDNGFVLSGHQGPSLTLLKRTYPAFELDARVHYSGEVAILWGYSAPLGPDRPVADATLHPMTLTRHHALTLTADTWRIMKTGDALPPETVASGPLAAPAENISLSLSPSGAVLLRINDAGAWQGNSDTVSGAIGLLASPNSHLQVHRFSVTGESSAGISSYLYTDAILGAGAAHETWKETDDTHFRYGVGAVSMKPGARAKWNVEGAKFELWAPTGPGYGQGAVLVDGIQHPLIDFHAETAQTSHVVWTSADIFSGQHAIVLVAEDKEIPLDSLSVMTQDK